MNLPTDLRGAITDAIARSANRHHVLRLDADAPFAAGPCLDVVEFTQWMPTAARGLLAFIYERCSFDRPLTLDDVDAFDQEVQRRIRVRSVVEALVSAYCPQGTEPEQFLERVLAMGAAEVAELEARATVAVHFTQLACPAEPTDIQIFADRTEGVFLRFVEILVARSQSHKQQDILLAPVGLDASWSRQAARLGGTVRIVDDVTDAALADWLRTVHGPVGVYVPLINQFTGQILTRHRAEGIARVVLQHNRENPYAPVFVFADDAGADSFHSDEFAIDARPLGAATGTDIGDSALGQMSDWTVSIATADKVFGVVDSPVVFAVTRNRWLRVMLRRNAKHKYSPSDVLVAASALCLTPRDWLNEANERAEANLRTLRKGLLSVNAGLGFDAITVNEQTAGGRHTALRLHPRLFSSPVDNSFDALDVLLNMSWHDRRRTAIALAPGELFCWSYRPNDPDPRLTMRLNLAVSAQDLDEALKRLDMITSILWSSGTRDYSVLH